MNIDIPKPLKADIAETKKTLCGIEKALRDQNKLLNVIAVNQREYFNADLKLRKIQLGIEPISSLKEGGNDAATREEA